MSPLVLPKLEGGRVKSDLTKDTGFNVGPLAVVVHCVALGTWVLG